ncbi:hypothetical protein M408DRAFT_81549, partial [Serendipita vermifera MAFF 305830]
MDNPAAITIADAARLYNVPPKTLGYRRRGGKPKNQAHESQQLLTKIQEDVLVLYCQNRGWRHEPVDLEELRQLAQQLCGDKPGKKWHIGFFNCHPEIKRRWAKAGESKRANGLNRANTKDPKITADESRKMVTILECVNAIGYAIGPLVIHAGKEKDLEWIRQNPCKASIAASPKGWTDAEIAYEWLRDVFDPQTSEIAKGSTRLLILDGHNSHCTIKLAFYAAKRNIIIFQLPPHTTHRLQPLDVGVFGPLSLAWQKIVREWAKNGYVVRKNNLISLYSLAREKALTATIISAAFRSCGIEPFDPSVVTEE